MSGFADNLIDACIKKKSSVLVGIDPRKSQLPEDLLKLANDEGDAKAFLEFGKAVIDSVKDIAVAIKPQIAFYEVLGPEGMQAYKETLLYATQNNLLTISDAKRGDIGSTASAYAEAFLGSEAAFPSDSVTVNAYLGIDGIKPFIDLCEKNDKGLFILVKTSNPSSKNFQDKQLKTEDRKLFEEVAISVNEWGKGLVGKSGYSSIGAVVGATWPEEAIALRSLMPQTPFLIPGYGAQGGSSKDAMASFDKDGLGGVVNSSRGIIFAYEKEEYKDLVEQKGWRAAISKAAEKMQEDLNSPC